MKPTVTSIAIHQSPGRQRREGFLPAKLGTNVVGWTEDAIQPGTGFTTKPGVAATRRTPGCDESRSKPQRGFTRSAANASVDCGTPFGVQTLNVDRNPGCAAPRRPWALLCNPAGVFKTLFCHTDRPRTQKTQHKILHGVARQGRHWPCCVRPWLSDMAFGYGLRIWPSDMAFGYGLRIWLGAPAILVSGQFPVVAIRVGAISNASFQAVSEAYTLLRYTTQATVSRESETQKVS